LQTPISSGASSTAFRLRKHGEPDDVVGLAVFLASDPSAMITEHLLWIDGGVTAIVSLTTEPVVR
jgi:NAD(P)-dependent dehydrogenase (short-subunit alcohol dehydrogenase family)